MTVRTTTATTTTATATANTDFRPAEASSTPPVGSVEELAVASPASPASATAPTTSRLCSNDVARLTRDVDAVARKRFPTEGERDVLIAALAKLPAADCRDVLADPARLQRVVDAAGDEQRGLLLDLLMKKGIVDAQPAAPIPATSPRAPQPPAATALLRDDPRAPPALRRAILDENVARAADYRVRYADYRAAYAGAVARAPDVAALRDLGPLAPSTLPMNLPGAPLHGEANRAWLDARGRTDDDIAITLAVADRFRRLTGRAIAGLSFTAEVEASIVLGDKEGSHVELGGKAEATVGPDGHVEQHSVGAHKVGLEHSSATYEHGKLGIEVTADGNGVAISEEEIALKAHFAPLSGEATFGGDRMAFAVGVEQEVELMHGLHGKLGVVGKVGLQGVTGEDAAAFASTSAVGFFDTPAELSRGKAWSSLPAPVRADYERQGWTAAEWTKKADLARFARRAA
ncbi:MAG: hypothetical protein FJ137_03750 [Deltaproteobacteria bacterium]|nr:hypothetical protein [Deltaproteobacteria bacterium]